MFLEKNLPTVKCHRVKRPDEAYALLGQHDLYDKSETSSIKSEFQNIIVHHNWNASIYANNDYDIALVKLMKDIIFTNLIQPVCLPEMNENVHDVSGTVVGHGYTEEGKISNKTKHVEVSTVQDNVCLYNVPDLAKIGSIR